jgi:hypothetical protein
VAGVDAVAAQRDAFVVRTLVKAPQPVFSISPGNRPRRAKDPYDGYHAPFQAKDDDLSRASVTGTADHGDDSCIVAFSMLLRILRVSLPSCRPPLQMISQHLVTVSPRGNGLAMW